MFVFIIKFSSLNKSGLVYYYLSFVKQFPFVTEGDLMVYLLTMLDCDIVVSEFKFQLGYYIHFQITTLGKGMKPLIPPVMG